uniref:non-ribosomal peptide synthetase n=1 Tax=Nonomuraea lactucae TaxID=2249762 RepID=UPI0013B43627
RHLADLARAAGLACLIIEPAGRRLEGAAPVAVELSRDCLAAGDRRERLAPHPYASTDAAYLYFSTGTGGEPKPILGRCDSLFHFVEWEIEELGLRAGTRVAQLTSPSHDPYLRDVFAALLTAGTICVPDGGETVLSPFELSRWIERAEVELLHCTPTVFRNLCRALPGSGGFPRLRHVAIAGEQLFGKDLLPWYAAFGDRVQLVNLYGPTETTLAKLCYRVSAADAGRAAVPIGRPIRDTAITVLPGGELVIETLFGTLGYHGRSTLTDQVFRPHPLEARGRPVAYRTGDLVRVLPDGNLEFAGRSDRQVKLGGVRVELDGVERVILRHPDVSRCAVELEPEGRLVAYYGGPEAPDGAALRRYLAERVPASMVPAGWVRVPYWPVNVNGKTDRRQLASLVPAPPDGDAEPARPDVGAGPEEGSPTGRLLALWRELLGDQALGVDDAFVDSGGDSLSIMLLIAKVEEMFDYELPLAEVFEDLTVRRLSRLVDAAGRGAL